MDLSPWDYYLPDGSPKPETTIAIAQLERVKAADPQHPGALHFYIHAVEATATPERAEVAADELGDLVPVAGHLVHMPAHIYLRVGRYHDAVTAERTRRNGRRGLHRAVQRAGFLSGGVLPAQPALPVVRGDDGRPEETVARHRAQDGATRAARFRALDARGSAVPAGADLHAGALRFVGRHARRTGAARRRAVRNRDVALRTRRGVRAQRRPRERQRRIEGAARRRRISARPSRFKASPRSSTAWCRLPPIWSPRQLRMRTAITRPKSPRSKMP